MVPMDLSKMFLACLFVSIINIACCNRERKMAEVLESLRRIEEHLSKEDRLWKITNITRIDFTVDKLSSKVDRILSILESTSPIATGRSEGAVSPLSNDMESIQEKLQSLEASVSNVEETMKSLNFDPTKVNEIERRTTQLKDDMNTKLRKIMNVMTSLYELNKDMKSNAESRPDVGETSTGYSTEFVVENLEEMERKIKEQLSVLSNEIRTEITGLKIVASTVGSSCQGEEAGEEEEGWMTPEARRNTGGRSAGGGIALVMERLGRSTQEIREEIQSGMQGIDMKLTVLAQSQPTCDPLEASESAAVSKSAASDEKCTKATQSVPNPKSCADLRRGGATCDGIYVVFPRGVRAVRVLCDMTSDGGGWTVVMRRGDYGDKMTSFNRNWLSYKNGFGDSEGEFWLGNDVIHHLTAEEPSALRIRLAAFDGDRIDLDYAAFSVANESAHYRSRLGPAVGGASVASNGFRYHSNRPFSTFDRKNDRSAINCAARYKGGWWFNGCYQGFLTGEYFRRGEARADDSQGILWHDWKRNEPLQGAAMLLRPADFD